MRRVRLIPYIALLAFAAAAPALAQFDPPDPAELKMTTDAKAPDAASVYLYREETSDRPKSIWTEYERIKVLTEKGKEMATVRVPFVRGYDKIASIDARTIHADGTIIPLTDKPNDLVDLKTKDVQLDTLVFNLPSVEVGSILEYRIRVKYSNGLGYPTWMIQQPTFVHKAHYALMDFSEFSPAYMSYVASGARVIKGKGGLYTLDVTDVPPAPNDDWMPPLNAIKWRVHFFYTTFNSSAAYWDASARIWATNIREITNPNGTLKKAAASLVSPGDSDTVKAQKIYAAMMKLENTDFARKISQAERKKEKIKDINTVQDVWKQQRGSSDDIALLFVALARGANLNVAPMFVVDRNRAMFDENLLATNQLDDYIAVAQLDGKEVFLDPGEKFCPFGTLHWKHALTSGFRLSDKAGIRAETPNVPYNTTALHRVGDLTIDPDGAVKGAIRFVLTGQEALYWRQLTLQVDQDELKKQFNESIEHYIPDGVHAEFDHFLGLEEYDTNLVGTVQVSGTLGTATGKRFFLPGLFLQSRATHPFVAQDKRTMPVDVHYPKIEEDDVIYHLPPGFTVESRPQPATISWNGFATLKINSAAKGDVVRVVRVLAYNYTILDPKKYDELRSFYQKVATADQQPLVLTRTPAVAAKGN